MSGKTKSLQPGGAKDLRKENTHCPNIQATLADSQGKSPGSLDGKKSRGLGWSRSNERVRSRHAPQFSHTI
jgi:hypothetical protein